MSCWCGFSLLQGRKPQNQCLQIRLGGKPTQTLSYGPVYPVSHPKVVGGLPCNGRVALVPVGSEFRKRCNVDAFGGRGRHCYGAQLVEMWQSYVRVSYELPMPSWGTSLTFPYCSGPSRLRILKGLRRACLYGENELSAVSQKHNL